MAATFTEGDRYFAHLPLFDPETGTTVREPLSSGRGWWAGAPGALYDSATETFYLVYRLRKPLELGRGVLFRIATSEDGIRFDDVWEAPAGQLASPSVERHAMIRRPDGTYLVYISYVDPSDDRWRIDVIPTDDLTTPNVDDRQKVFTAADVGCEGVKDPAVYNIGGLYHMLISYAPTPPNADEIGTEAMHGTADIYNTGTSKSCSAVATSLDGVHWDWQGDILSPPERGWDSYATRLGSIIWHDGAWIGFYDGSEDVSQNYEERCGMATSFDLRHWTRVTPRGPILTSPRATGSLRYVDVLKVKDRLFYYYEYARADGSHELRVNVVPVFTGG